MPTRKRRILFVDDDPLALRGFERAAEAYEDDWEVYLARSGAEALHLLAQMPADVLITDMRMPEMDGSALLEAVSRRFPGVVRFVLSGNTEEGKMLETARLAHQFFAKPCDMAYLYQRVEAACRLRERLNSPQMVQLVTGIKKLPSLPTLYIRLMKALQSEDPTPKQIGEIIAQDVAMTAKILQLVNSAFFGLPGKITSPQRAVTILGVNTIKALVLGIQVFGEYQASAAPAFFSIDQLWRHSLQTGSIAKAIAASAGLEASLQDEAQLAGVLHDVGKLLQLKIPAFFQQVKVTGGAVVLSSEYEAFGVSHAELGAYLLSIWGLPGGVVGAVAYHHRPQSGATGSFAVLDAVHIANGL